jgi:predicted ATP-grasp superfamily ATP-dependent carboligase
MRRVLIAGVSTRAAAESAARSGFEVTAIDAFCDLDQHPSVHAVSIPRPFSAHAAARAGQRIESDAVGYLSNFENHPDAVRMLAAGRELWGNRPDVLRRVRDPMILMQALTRRGWAAPAVRTSAASVIAGGEHRDGRRWLVKPLASGGGHAVRLWHGAEVPSGCYLQELITGTPHSVVFVAAGGRAVPLGLSRQLVGEGAFGAAGYRYCGSILASFGDADRLVDAACTLTCTVAEEFDLVGVNGIDFIARDGCPYAVEVNPRWTASMELVEIACGISVFEAHAAACTFATLPIFNLQRAQRGTGAAGKAVVFAREDITVGDTSAWIADATVRDVPHPGELIRSGRPVCTVFASGSDDAACHAALACRAARVYADLAAWKATATARS